MAASSPPTSTARRRPRAVRPGHVLALVLAVIFIAQNRSRVHMSFFTVDVSAPARLLLTTMTLVGLAVGLLLGRMKRCRHRSSVRRKAPPCTDRSRTARTPNGLLDRSQTFAGRRGTASAS